MKPLHIVWQRLVNSSGRTCDRCGGTQESLERAVAKLKVALAPLGMEPVLETKEIDEELFKRDTSESNRIWIEGRPLEELLGATVGASRCCAVCGEAECRTIDVHGTVYEVVSEELILRAALAAAARAPRLPGEGMPRSEQADAAKSSCCTASP